jgi:beta-galactosidase beta subunit
VTDKGNQYTYDGLKDKERQSTYMQWMNTDKGNQLPTMDKQTFKGKQYTYDGRTDRQRQFHRRYIDYHFLSVRPL